jgi:hypothetical protein
MHILNVSITTLQSTFRKCQFKGYLFYTVPESFMWIWVSGPVVREKIFKYPILILHVCDYLLFEKVVALYLNNLKFLAYKDDLYQDWLKLIRWLWKRFFPHVKMVFPIIASSDPKGPWIEQTWICTMSGSFHENLSFSGQVVLGKDF